jgi:hypothetical protein
VLKRNYKNNLRFFVLFFALAKNKTIKQEQITKPTTKKATPQPTVVVFGRSP